MISFSVVFFLPLTFLLLHLLSAVCNSFYLSFLYSSPTLSTSLNAIPIAMSVFLASISSPRSGNLLLLAIFHVPFSSTWPAQPDHQLILITFLHSYLHSKFVDFLLSALLTPTIILTRYLFANLDLLPLFLCCFTWCASPITPSTFLQPFDPAVILIVTKAINLVDCALGKCHILSWIDLL